VNDYGIFAASSTADLPHDETRLLRHNRRMADKLSILVERIAAKLVQLNLSEREASIDATGKPDAIRYIRTRNSMPSAERLERIARTLGTTPAWLLGGTDDIDPPEARQGKAIEAVVRRRLPKSLPVYGTALAADLDLFATDGHPVAIEQVEVDMVEPSDHMARPLNLVGLDGYYVVTIVGESMVPRFDPGRRSLVNSKREARAGEDVVVQLRSPMDDGETVTAVLIKQLVKHKTGAIVLRQFNPAVEFELSNSRVKHVHPIVPWDDALSI